MNYEAIDVKNTVKCPVCKGWFYWLVDTPRGKMCVSCADKDYDEDRMRLEE